MLITEQMSDTEKFSTNELIIIDFIKSVDFHSYSARQIAKETFTSPSTVVRLCRKFKYDSFQDFKEAYLKELEYIHRIKRDIDGSIPFKEDDSFYEICNILSVLTKETAEDTVSGLNHDDLNRAVQYIKDSKNIYVFSSGTTINLAKIFQEQMLKIGCNVIVYDSQDLQFIKSMHCLESDCFILMSYTGETTRILQLARNLKRKKAKIIAITSMGNNRLSSLASCELNVSSREKISHNIGNFSTIVSMNLILNIIYSCLFRLNYDSNDQAKTSLEHYREVQRQRDAQKNIK